MLAVMPPWIRLVWGMPKTSEDSATLNVSAAVQFLGPQHWTQKRLRAHVARKTIPFRKLGGRILFLRKELEVFLDNLPGCKLEDILNESTGCRHEGKKK